MKEMRALLVAETRLLFRDPITWLAAIALPTVILVIFGSMFGPQEPDPAFGGLRFIDVFVPSLIVITIGTLGIQTLPIRLATYREKGSCAACRRRPPTRSGSWPRSWSIYMVTAVIALVVLVVVANVAFGVPLPRQPIGYLAAFLVGLGAMFAIGACWPRWRRRTAWPRRSRSRCSSPSCCSAGSTCRACFLPDILVRIGEFTPPGVQGLQDAWFGTAPQALPLLGMALVTLVVGAWRSGCSGGSDVSVDASFPSRTGCSSVPAMSSPRGRAGSGSATACSTGAGTSCSPWRRSSASRPGIRIRSGRRRPWRSRRWRRCGCTSATRRRPLPNIDHRLRLDVFFVGLLVLASILMLRQPLFFVFMIAGFFYATILRPLPLAVVGIAASSILVNTLIAGVPQTAEAWTFYLAIIGVQTVAISAGAVSARRSPSRARNAARRSPGSRRRWRRTPASTPSCSPRPARRASSTSGSGWRARSTTRSPRA